MTEARLGYGTLIQRWSGAAWVTVAEQVTVSGPSLSSDDVEVTNPESPNSTKEYIPALLDTGEVSFNGNFIPGNASQQQLLTDQVARTVADWQIVLPDAVAIADRTKWSFEGYIKSIDFSYPTPTQMTINATMKLAGTATLASVYALNLTGLTISEGTLTPAFAVGTYNYAATVLTAVTTLNIRPTCAAADSIKVNGVVTASGADAAFPVAIGVNYATIDVFEDDKTPRRYAITIARASA